MTQHKGMYKPNNSASGLLSPIGKWLADAFKIACGVCVGYGFFFIYAVAFELVVLPAIGLFIGR